jgi:nitrate/TMAO reductase-like tetraheme cytochrome c subunit
MIQRREGQTHGQPPKYLGYEDDTYKVVEAIEPSNSGGLIYLCECKLCGGTHERSSQQLQRKSKARECPEVKPHNWSGFDREDAIMRRTYGISMEDFDALVEFQNGNCAVCFKPLEVMNRRANIDHDHETNEVRGILCTGCNTGIGHLGDNIEGLKRALYYLENTPYSEFKENI